MIDLSTLATAVKPKERTDQYKILAALYVLEAHVKPVTSTQVRQQLALQFGKKIPSNIPGCLSTYTAYASRADLGPPIKWRLTEKGLDRLRTLSGLPLQAQSTSEAFASDVGIVCALQDPELQAVMRAFGGPLAWQEIGDTRHAHVYRETELKTATGTTLKVIATTSTSMGLTAAAIATTQLVLQYRPKLVAMIGIAAGTKSGKKQFGDVLVADPSVDYNSGKIVLENGTREFQPDPYPIGLNPRLRSVLQKYRGTQPLFDEIRKRWKGGKLPPGANRLHVGPVGAADQVIDDPTRVIEIQKNWRKLIGMEMETYGVYRAVEESPEPKPRAVSFKSVCDFGEGKTDSWQEYAAFTAAEFASEFLRREWSALWPTA